MSTGATPRCSRACGTRGTGIELRVANSLWARKDVEFGQDFLQRNREFYDARVTTLDFGSPGALDTINSWVKAQTNGRIPTIIDGITPADTMFLINAVYFKGQWTNKFDASRTKDHAFTLLGGGTKTVRMMSRRGRYSYFAAPDFQAISLPYGDGRLSMYVFLPIFDGRTGCAVRKPGRRHVAEVDVRVQFYAGHDLAAQVSHGVQG